MDILSVIKEKKNTITIIKDSYRFGFKWEKYVRKNCNKLIIIDDFPDKKHFADCYINHSPHFDNPKIDLINLIKKNNKKKCQFLLGTKYALLNLKSGKKSIRSDIVFYNGGSGNILVYEKGYKFKGSGILNMFPNTSHIESISVFEYDK